MASSVQVTLRTVESYTLAQQALSEMQRRSVWPTPLNFEIWLHVVGEPDGPLNREVKRLCEAGEPITEARSEALAASFLPGRHSEVVLNAGDELSHQLDGVRRAIQDAQRSSADYGATLAGASKEMQDAQPHALERLITTLTEATRTMQVHNTILERRLSDSTCEVQRLQQNLDVARRDAMTDALTNLANRKAFDEGLATAAAHAVATGEPLTLVVLDIDHFKRFNDTWGHQTGDQVLRYVASVLGRVGAAPRLAARYGGEEFAVVMPGDVAENAAQLFHGVLAEIAGRSLKRRSTNEDLGAVTVSAGVAQSRFGETVTELIARADQALYASKNAGRNRVTSAEPPLRAVA